MTKWAKVSPILCRFYQEEEHGESLSPAHWLHPDLQGVNGQGRNRFGQPFLWPESPSQRTIPQGQNRFSRGPLRSEAKPWDL